MHTAVLRFFPFAVRFVSCSLLRFNSLFLFLSAYTHTHTHSSGRHVFSLLFIHRFILLSVAGSNLNLVSCRFRFHLSTSNNYQAISVYGNASVWHRHGRYSCPKLSASNHTSNRLHTAAAHTQFRFFTFCSMHYFCLNLVTNLKSIQHWTFSFVRSLARSLIFH